MASINLHAQALTSVTYVSNYFIDYYMKDLSGDSVRVYLCLLRCIYDPSMKFSIASTAENLGITARKVRTSIDRLSSCGLVKLDYDDDGELCDICMQPLTVRSTETTSEKPAAKPAVKTTQNDHVVSATESEDENGQLSFSFSIPKEPEQAEAPAENLSQAHEESDRTVPPIVHHDAEEFEDDFDIAQITFLAERYLGIRVNSSDLDTIIYWHTDLGLSVDLIDYLITNSLDNGKRPKAGLVNYMNSIAVSWYKDGITTIEAAKNDTKEHSAEVSTVRKAFGINSALAESQLAYIDRWFNEWHFSSEMVSEACGRTMANISTPNFNYADSILRDWHQKGLTDVSQLAGDDEAHTKEVREKFAPKNGGGYKPKKNGFNSYSEKNSYDSKAIEAMLLKNNTF